MIVRTAPGDRRKAKTSACGTTVLFRTQSKIKQAEIAERQLGTEVSFQYHRVSMPGALGR